MSSPAQPEIPAPLSNLKIQYTKVRKTLAGGAFPGVLVKHGRLGLHCRQWPDLVVNSKPYQASSHKTYIQGKCFHSM